MDKEAQLKKIVEYIEEIKGESQVPKNVKTKLDEVIQSLSSKSEASIKVNKALSLLDEISDDSNLQSFERTQIWNIVSLLEKV